MAYSLTYSFDSTSQSYSVNGYSNITESDIVVIPDTYDDGTNGSHPVTSIGPNAFYNCSGLTSVTIPDSVTRIGSYAFKNCGSLTSIIIPDSVTSIGNYAFLECTSLKSLKLGNGLTSVGFYAFQKCSSLTNVEIPKSLKVITNGMFHSCSNLTSVIIPEGVESIEQNTFAYCEKLTCVVIPESVTGIGKNAFENCTNLNSIIIFNTTPPTLGSWAIPNNVQFIYVPQFSKELYKVDTNWTSLSSKIVSDNLYLSFIRFNQKNKEYIERKVDGLSTATNIENGIGLDSLVQTYSGEVDDTHFASSTTGESDVCLGEANTSSGKRNILGGKLNENAGSNNLIAGLRNNVSSNHNVVGGQENTSSQGNDNLIGGQQNTVKSGNNIVAGHENTVSENGQSNIVVGEQNLLGKVVNSIICGDNDNIKIEQLIGGIKAGHDLLNNSDIQGKALLGQYNKPKTNTLLEIGNGTGPSFGLRKNAFEVLKDGRAKVQSAPVDDDDVVRKQELDSLSNDIDTAMSIAKGRATGYVFDTKSDMDAWLENAENVSNLVLGDNLYIRAVDTPDYWWDGSSAQMLETQKVDLTNYVQSTDYADYSKNGIVRGSFALFGAKGFFQNGTLYLHGASDADIANRVNYVGLTTKNIDKVVKAGITTNTETLTDEEKNSACEWLGTLKKPTTPTEDSAVILNADGTVGTKPLSEIGGGGGGGKLYLHAVNVLDERDFSGISLFFYTYSNIAFTPSTFKEYFSNYYRYLGITGKGNHENNRYTSYAFVDNSDPSHENDVITYYKIIDGIGSETTLELSEFNDSYGRFYDIVTEL